MIFNEFGKIANKYWNDIPNHYKNVELDYYVIMPNHLHGIIIIENNVETGHAPSLQLNKNITLSNIIGSFKSAVTKNIHIAGLEIFSWQTRFFDRIIRNEKELYKIRKYIHPVRYNYEILLCVRSSIIN
jgi:putative transposase